MHRDTTTNQHERSIDALPDAIAELVRKSSTPAPIPREEEPFDRIGEIKVDVRIEFPTVRIARSDAEKLKPGSSIPLKGDVDTPVNIVVCDRVIARGEIVIVDGCYGVRILEFIS